MNKIKNYIGEIVFTLVLLTILVLYMIDVYSASGKVNNLLMIFPIGFITIGLFAIAIITLAVKVKKYTKDIETPKFGKKELKIIASMVIYFFYSVAIMAIGFDAGTFLFVMAMLLLQGERTPLKLILFPLIFSVLVSIFFSLMIPYPMPMLLNYEIFQIF
jgi:hypothetical protein